MITVCIGTLNINVIVLLLGITMIFRWYYSLYRYWIILLAPLADFPHVIRVRPGIGIVKTVLEYVLAHYVLSFYDVFSHGRRSSGPVQAQYNNMIYDDKD